MSMAPRPHTSPVDVPPRRRTGRVTSRRGSPARRRCGPSGTASARSGSEPSMRATIDVPPRARRRSARRRARRPPGRAAADRRCGLVPRVGRAVVDALVADERLEQLDGRSGQVVARWHRRRSYRAGVRISPMQASERQRASGHQRPAWPGNAAIGTGRGPDRARSRPSWPCRRAPSPEPAPRPRDARRVALHQLGRRGQLVGDAQLLDAELVAVGIAFADVAHQRRHPGDADGDVGLSLAPGAAERVADDHGDVDAVVGEDCAGAAPPTDPDRPAARPPARQRRSTTGRHRCSRTRTRGASR